MKHDESILMEVLPYWSRYIGKAFKRTLSEGMSPPMDHALKMMRVPKPMSELARLMGISKQQMTVIVDKLIKLDLAERKADAHDRRLIIVSVTENGERYLKRQCDSVQNEFKLMFDNMTVTDRERFIDALGTIYDVLKNMDE